MNQSEYNIVMREQIKRMVEFARNSIIQDREGERCFEFSRVDTEFFDGFYETILSILPDNTTVPPDIFPRMDCPDTLVIEWLNLSSEVKTSLCINVKYDEGFFFNGWAAPDLYDEDAVADLEDLDAWGSSVEDVKDFISSWSDLLKHV